LSTQQLPFNLSNRSYVQNKTPSIQSNEKHLPFPLTFYQINPISTQKFRIICVDESVVRQK
jgi:hypothetical protein